MTVETIEHGPFKESFLEIRRRRGKEVKIVTTIEILSPANKKIGNPGREKFLEKQRETLASETHLVEIDLLRGGAHTLAVPKDLVTTKAGPFEYLVSIHRFNRPTEFLVYPITLRQRLPRIAIPLSPGDPDVPLDLQEVFDQSYDFGPYNREIEYGTDPIVPRLKARTSRMGRETSQVATPRFMMIDPSVDRVIGASKIGSSAGRRSRLTGKLETRTTKCRHRSPGWTLIWKVRIGFRASMPTSSCL